MPGYYRAIFTITKPDAPSPQVFTDAWQCVGAWAADTYGNLETPIKRSSISDEMRLRNLVHRYTDASSRNWRVSVRLATDSNAVEADIELRATDSDDADISLNLMAPPPSLIQTLLDRFDCRVGVDPIATTATRIGPEDAESFVKNELFNPDRQLPLLVLADFRDGSPVLDADQAQQELAGLAKVIAYDHNTAWNIMRDLQHELWCYDGAIRLFAPGCSADALEQQHPYWLLRHLDGVIRDNRLWQMLRDECLLRTPHQRQSRLLSRVENAINAEETKALQARMTELEQTNPDAKDFLELLKFVDELSAPGYAGNYDTSDQHDLLMRAIRRVKYTADRVNLENSQLRAEISQLRAKASPSADKPAPPRKEDTPTKQDFSSIHECAEHAAQNLPYLRFLPNARVTAQSPYTRQHNDKANRIYKTFEVLNECGRQRTQPGGLGKNVELWLKENREEYSDESEPTKRKYHQERTFFDPDKDDYIFMPHHIKLIGNDIRIHLIWDGDENKWLIGYIGRHLRTAQSPN